MFIYSLISSYYSNYNRVPALPNELWEKIFLEAGSEGMEPAPVVCKNWNQFFQEERIYRLLWKKENPLSKERSNFRLLIETKKKIEKNTFFRDFSAIVGAQKAHRLVDGNQALTLRRNSVKVHCFESLKKVDFTLTILFDESKQTCHISYSKGSLLLPGRLAREQIPLSSKLHRYVESLLEGQRVGVFIGGQEEGGLNIELKR